MDNQNESTIPAGSDNKSQFANQNTSGPSTRVCPRCHSQSRGYFCNQCGLNLNIYESPKNQMPYMQQPQAYANYSYQPQFQQNYNALQQPQYTPQFSQYYQYMQQSPKTKNKTWIIWLVAACIFIITMVACIFISTSVIEKATKPSLPHYSDGSDENDIANNPDYTPNGISGKELKQLEIGMSYAHVSKIVGGDGVLSDQGKTPQGTPYYIYTWISENDPNVFIHITFKDDKVADIVNQGVAN